VSPTRKSKKNVNNVLQQIFKIKKTLLTHFPLPGIYFGAQEVSPTRKNKKNVNNVLQK
jgi:hypothetical protein